jgi:CMP-N,N'-diacetyllegionaminic acid synthase
VKNIYYALIPAKLNSSRCINKNWRPFFGGGNIVSYSISTLPEKFFKQVILSTDKADLPRMNDVLIHRRNTSLSSVNSSVNDLISLIIQTYEIPGNAYLWLLNPTSPFRERNDFFNIDQIIKKHSPESIVSVSCISPFLWKNSEPLFQTAYPRQNTQDVPIQYGLENGQFYVFKVELFNQHHTWYSEKNILYKQTSLSKTIDIDTEEDFVDAQKWIQIQTQGTTR